MNLAEIMVYTDIKVLHQIAQHYGLTCDVHSKNELITTLLMNVKQRDTIVQEVEQLTPSESHFLLLLFFDKRSQYSLEDLLAKGGIAVETVDVERKEGVRKLIASALKRGWIFPAKGGATGQFQVPNDLREPYVQALLDSWKLKSPLGSRQAETVLAYRDEGVAACDDLLQILRFIGNEPIPLTAEGGMYRRFQVQLLKFLTIQEEPLAPQKWRFGYGLHFDLYPERFSLLYDYCYYQRWIHETSSQVEITEHGFEQLKKSYNQQTYHDLINFWMRLYKRAIPNMPMIVQVIPFMSKGKWIAQEEIEQTLLKWVKPFYYDDPISILTNRVLKMMVHLGLLKVGESATGDWLYASTDACQQWLRQYNGFVESTILLK
ncbi:hypothetical protein ACQCN2_04405 [Brevibacillus ginsengisoli]|uniref:hypothetical protein n=1 Tax=Brevibacillus ginsengisoli TaxID=363854 RepID=UPI003CF0EC6B